MLSESLHLHLVFNKHSALNSACTVIESQYTNHVSRAYKVGLSTKVAHCQVEGSNTAIWVLHVFVFPRKGLFLSFCQGCFRWREEGGIRRLQLVVGIFPSKYDTAAAVFDPIHFLWDTSKRHCGIRGDAGLCSDVNQGKSPNFYFMQLSAKS